MMWSRELLPNGFVSVGRQHQLANASPMRVCTPGGPTEGNTCSWDALRTQRERARPVLRRRVQQRGHHLHGRSRAAGDGSSYRGGTAAIVVVGRGELAAAQVRLRLTIRTAMNERAPAPVPTASGHPPWP